MRFFGLLAVCGAIALCAGVLVSRSWRFSANPEPELIEMLAQTEKPGITQPVEGARAPLISHTHHFDRVTVQLAADGKHAVATSTLDFTGVLGQTKVSSLGLERTAFVLGPDGWKIDGPAAPTLGAVVKALETRRQTLERQDARALAGLQLDARGKIPLDQERALSALLSLKQVQLDAKAWYIRSDRDTVLVTEEYRLQGISPDRPVDEVGKRRLQLLPAGDGGREFSFWPGLM